MTLTLKVKRLTETAKLPTYAHNGDACFDLYADDVTELSGGTIFTCSIGLLLLGDKGYWGGDEDHVAKTDLFHNCSIS